MSQQLEYTMAEFLELVAEERTGARREGFGEGFAAGAEDARRRLLARLDAYRSERSGSPHDVGGSVIDELKTRLAATVEDIDPRSRP